MAAIAGRDGRAVNQQHPPCLAKHDSPFAHRRPGRCRHGQPGDSRCRRIGPRRDTADEALGASQPIALRPAWDLADPLFTGQNRLVRKVPASFMVGGSNWASHISSPFRALPRGRSWQIGGTSGGKAPGLSGSLWPFRIQNLEPGRIRTGDPLFTNQDLRRPSGAVTCQQVPVCIRPPEISCRYVSINADEWSGVWWYFGGTDQLGRP